MAYNLTQMIAQSTDRRKPFALPAIKPPRTIERELLSIVMQVVRYWDRRLRDDLLPVYEAASTTFPQDSSVVRDSPADDLRDMIGQIAEGASRLILTVSPAVRNWTVRLERWHRGRWASTVRAATSLDVATLLADLTTRQEVQAYQQWASDLIRGLSDDVRRRVDAAVFQGLTGLEGPAAIRKKVRKITGIAGRRAHLIARDQTNKLSGKFDELRHREAGIDKYRWETALDERVRPTHRDNQGKVFSWDDPPAATGHPRTEINCRCTAQPWIEDLEMYDPARGFEEGRAAMNRQRRIPA